MTLDGAPAKYGRAPITESNKREATLLRALLEIDRCGYATLEYEHPDALRSLHYTKQGNKDFYTEEALQKREAVSRSCN